MRIIPIRFLLVFTITLCTACTGGSTRHAFRTSVEEGVRLAENTGGPAFDIPLFEYEVELTIEEDPDNPESLLFRPGVMMMDDEGYFYVLDRGDNRIVVYNPEGQYVRSFGRKGEGPGEFQFMNILRLEGDMLSIFDHNLQRTTHLRTDGTLLEVYRDPEPGSQVSWIERLPDGGFIRNASPDYSQEPEDPKIDYSADRVVATDADGDTLCNISTLFVPWGFEYSVGYGGGARRMDFVGYPMLLYVPGRGILMSTGVEPELTWYDLRGNVTERIHLALEVEPVTAEDRERVRQAAREEYESASEQRAASAKAMLDALQIPDEKAFWDRVEVDDSGYYWLQYAEQYVVRLEKGGPLCRVVSPEGEYLGNSRWPTWYGTITRGLYLAMVSDEETGAVTPTVFRIVPAVDGLKYP